MSANSSRLRRLLIASAAAVAAAQAVVAAETADTSAGTIDLRILPVDSVFGGSAGGDPHLIDGAMGDFDSDGLLNGGEYLLGLSPSVSDSDSNGLTDYFEWRYGFVTELSSSEASRVNDTNLEDDPDRNIKIEDYRRQLDEAEKAKK